LQDYKIVFKKVRVGDPPQDLVQMFRLDGGENNKSIGYPFKASQQGVIENMPGVKAALGLSDTKAELYSAENYKQFLQNNSDYLTSFNFKENYL